MIGVVGWSDCLNFCIVESSVLASNCIFTWKLFPNGNMSV